MTERIVHCLAPLLIGLAAACGAGSGEFEIVALVGDASVTQAELDVYFELNLLMEDGEEMDAKELDRVKSRLLDSLLDEKTLLAEAERRGLKVSGPELAIYIGDGGDGATESVSWERRRLLARQRILIQKLVENEVQKRPQPDDAEVQAYVDRELGRLAPQRRLRLRALRVDSMETAKTSVNQISNAIAGFRAPRSRPKPNRLAGTTSVTTPREVLQDLRHALVWLPPSILSGKGSLFGPRDAPRSDDTSPYACRTTRAKKQGDLPLASRRVGYSPLASDAAASSAAR